MRDDSPTPTPDPQPDAPSRATARDALVIWHGYLLGATGSNIYTHHLVDSWVRSGRDVVLACQERDPSSHPSIQEVVHLAHDPTTGEQREQARHRVRDRAPGEGRCTMVVPDLGGVLPVYVLDRYEGFEVVRVPGLDPARLDSYLAAHAGAMRWVLDQGPVAGVLVNHASPLPQALAPVLDAAGVPFAVKVHGSELEYALAEDPSLVPAAADALARATCVLVGSDHIERRTRELLGDAAVGDRAATVPPGVDLERFHPIERSDTARAEAHRRLVDELRAREATQQAGRGPQQASELAALVDAVDDDPARGQELLHGLAALHGSYEERHIERGASDAVTTLDPQSTRLLTYVGKLIPQKGVQLLLAALPDVLVDHPDVHVVVAGFGPLRDGLEALLAAMQRRDAAALDALAAGLGTLSGEGGDSSPHLTTLLAAHRAAGTLDAWLDRAAAARVHERVTWLGLVDHGVLAHLWPLCEASVVPSVLAEAFGMVAAEAAACGCVPVVGDHSGLADAARVIELHDVAPIRFDSRDPEVAVDELARVLRARLDLPADELARQAAAARANVAGAWGWDSLAAQVAELMSTPRAAGA